jgi:hypothetical protein
VTRLKTKELSRVPRYEGEQAIAERVLNITVWVIRVLVGNGGATNAPVPQVRWNVSPQIAFHCFAKYGRTAHVIWVRHKRSEYNSP